MSAAKQILQADAGCPIGAAHSLHVYRVGDSPAFNKHGSQSGGQDETRRFDSAVGNWLTLLPRAAPLDENFEPWFSVSRACRSERSSHRHA